MSSSSSSFLLLLPQSPFLAGKDISSFCRSRKHKTKNNCHTVDTKTYLGYHHFCLVSSICLSGAVGDWDSIRL